MKRSKRRTRRGGAHQHDSGECKASMCQAIDAAIAHIKGDAPYTDGDYIDFASRLLAFAKYPLSPNFRTRIQERSNFGKMIQGPCESLSFGVRMAELLFSYQSIDDYNRNPKQFYHNFYELFSSVHREVKHDEENKKLNNLHYTLTFMFYNLSQNPC
jgi:hypothetical protein